MPQTRAGDAIRRARTQFRRVQPAWEARSFGSDLREVTAGLRKSSLRSCCGTMLRQRERAATFRCDLGFRIVSSNRINCEVDQVTRTEVFAAFPQFAAAGCKETANEQFARAGVVTTPCGCRLLLPARTRGAHSALRSRTSESHTYRSIERAMIICGLVRRVRDTVRIDSSACKIDFRARLQKSPIPRIGTVSARWIDLVARCVS